MLKQVSIYVLKLLTKKKDLSDLIRNWLIILSKNQRLNFIEEFINVLDLTNGEPKFQNFQNIKQ